MFGVAIGVALGKAGSAVGDVDWTGDAEDCGGGPGEGGVSALTLPLTAAMNRRTARTVLWICVPARSVAAKANGNAPAAQRSSFHNMKSPAEPMTRFGIQAASGGGIAPFLPRAFVAAMMSQ
jgi:hypothetical protein